jgi:hypothetical protein
MAFKDVYTGGKYHKVFVPDHLAKATSGNELWQLKSHLNRAISAITGQGGTGGLESPAAKSDFSALTHVARGRRIEKGTSVMDLLQGFVNPGRTVHFVQSKERPLTKREKKKLKRKNKLFSG